MKIVAIPDMHGSAKGLDRLSKDLSKAEVVLLAGDLTNFGGQKEAADIVVEVRRYAKNIYAVPGNCDYSDVINYLTEQGINLHGKGVVINGFALIGVGGSLPAPGHTPLEYSEKELEDLLNQALSDVPDDSPLILMAHQPPINTNIDQVAPGRHVGSKAVRTFIENYQPLICFSGHIHEGVGIDSIGKTKLINPGHLRTGGYAYAEVGESIHVLEIRNF
jgi:Icc-related predicted phosphoesterase